jgi:hypothetical protein
VSESCGPHDRWGYKRLRLLRWEWWFYGDSHYFYYGFARTRRRARKHVWKVGDIYYRYVRDGGP